MGCMAAFLAKHLLVLCAVAAVGSAESGMELQPQYIPETEASEVNVYSYASRFQGHHSYALVLSQFDGTSWSVVGSSSGTPCIVSGPSQGQLRCNVSGMAQGTALVSVRENSTEVHSDVLWVYEQPQVSSIAPSQLPLAGGKLLTFTFSQAIATYGSITARFEIAGAVASCQLDMTAQTALSATCRSPAVESWTSGVTANVAISLNGQSFVNTGKTASFSTMPRLKVGFIYVGAPTDFGWNFQHNVARLYLESRFYGQIQTVYQNYVTEWGPNMCSFCHEEPGWDANAQLGMWSDEPSDFFGTHEASVVTRRWVEEEGVGMVIGTSWWYHWDMYHMANRYPNVSFAHVGAWLTRPNMAQVFPKIYQARYLSGIAMAWYIRKHNLPKRVGYVSAFPLGETARAISAFKLGMEQVDPDIEIFLTYLMTWHDDRKETIGAQRLFTYYGVEGIAQHTDSRTPQIVAQEMGKVGIGYNTDMLLTVGDSVLTSPVLVWGEDYARMIQRVLDGEDMASINYWGGANEGTWRLSEFSSHVPTEAKQQIEEEHAKLMRGEDTIFCKPNMRDNRGRIRNGPTNPIIHPPPWEADHLIPGTTCLTDNVVNMACQEYVNGNCVDHWLLEGVHDSCEPSAAYPNGITHPNLPNGTCFLGIMNLPDVCPDGMHLTLLGCEPVPPGHFARNEVAEPCPVGYDAPAARATACDPCPSGSFSGVIGSTNCSLCQPGNYSDAAGMGQCRICQAGRYADSTGATACQLCDFGTFSDEAGASACSLCPPGLTTLRMAETEMEACVCLAGHYRPLGSTHCATCPNGMTCPTGSDMQNSPNGPGPFPQAQPGYMTLSSEPLEVYKCAVVDFCPGGAPGSCADYRDINAPGCGKCVEDAYEDNKTCYKCEGGVDFFPLIIFILVGIAGVIAATFAVNRDLLMQTNAKMMVIILLGLMCTGIQTLGVFNQLNIVWFPPMNIILRLVSVLGFNIEVLKMGCILGSNPLVTYTCRQFIAPMSIPFILATLLLKKRNKPHTDIKKELCNTVGSIFNIFYISILISSAAPFVCYDHPGTTGSSMMSAPSVLCFADDGNDHSFMVTVGLLAFILVALPFTVAAVWFTISYPKFIAHGGHRNVLHSFRFLYFRYTPERYFYGVIMLARSFFICFVPVVVRNSAVQVFILCVLLCGFLLVQQQLCPWRSAITNVLDGVLCVFLILLLICAAMVTDYPLDSKAIQAVGMTAFVAFVLVGLVAFVIGVHKILQPHPYYHRFICHHKAHAAGQARLLKMMLERRTRESIFIDSDNLQELDKLFDTVKCRVDKMVIYLTHDTLSRPWCAGEIVTAFSSKATVTAIKTPSFEAPTEEQLLNLETLIDMTGCNLLEYGITMEAVEEAFRRLISKDTCSIDIRRDLGGSQRFNCLVDEILNKKPGGGDAPELPRLPVKPGMVVISSDHRSDEAIAATCILLDKIREEVMRVTEEGLCCLMDYSLDDTDSLAHLVRQARAVCVILSPGTLEDITQLTTIVEVMSAVQFLHETEKFGRPPESLGGDPDALVNKSSNGSLPADRKAFSGSMARQASKTSGGSMLAVISVNIPGFTFPSDDYYERRLPMLWPNARTLNTARELVRSFFKRISILFATGASDQVLDVQAQEVFSRVPSKFRASGRSDSITGALLEKSLATMPPAGHSEGQGNDDIAITGRSSEEEPLEEELAVDFMMSDETAPEHVDWANATGPFSRLALTPKPGCPTAKADDRTTAKADDRSIAPIAPLRVV